MDLQLLQLCKHSVQTVTRWTETLTALVPAVTGPTVVSSVQAFDGASADSQSGDGVPVAAEDLQPAEGGDVQLRQAAVPHIQLGHVAQLLRLPHGHLVQLVQPEMTGGSVSASLPTSQLFKIKARDFFHL